MNKINFSSKRIDTKTLFACVYKISPLYLHSIPKMLQNGFRTNTEASSPKLFKKPKSSSLKYWSENWRGVSQNSQLKDSYDSFWMLSTSEVVFFYFSFFWNLFFVQANLCFESVLHFRILESFSFPEVSFYSDQLKLRGKKKRNLIVFPRFSKIFVAKLCTLVMLWVFFIL